MRAVRAFIFREHGGPQTQELADRPRPVPGPGELLVAVRAAGVNPGDWKTRAGYPREAGLPKVFGAEVAGIVGRTGPGVTGFKVGDAVFGSTVTGAFAQYALVPVATAARKPDRVSFTDAATLPAAAATAYDGVHQLNLTPGEALLVTGVGGGVGVAAAQLAHGLGVRVIGTASAAKKRFAESLGVTHVSYGDGVAGRLRPVAPDGVDAIYDLVGGSDLAAVAGLLADRSRLISAADPATARSLGGGPVRRARSGEVLTAVARLVETGALTPHVTEIYPLDRAAAALAAVEGGHARGKIVIEVR